MILFLLKVFSAGLFVNYIGHNWVKKSKTPRKKSQDNSIDNTIYDNTEEKKRPVNEKEYRTNKGNTKTGESTNSNQLIERDVSTAGIINEIKRLKFELKNVKRKLRNQRRLLELQKKRTNERLITFKGGGKMAEEKNEFTEDVWQDDSESKKETKSGQLSECVSPCEVIEFCCPVTVPEGFMPFNTKNYKRNVRVAPRLDFEKCLKCKEKSCCLDTNDLSCPPVEVNQIMIRGCIEILLSFHVRPEVVNPPASTCCEGDDLIRRRLDSYVCCKDCVCIRDFITVCYSCKECDEIDFSRIVDVKIKEVTGPFEPCKSINDDQVYGIKGELIFDCNKECPQLEY